ARERAANPRSSTGKMSSTFTSMASCGRVAPGDYQARLRIPVDGDPAMRLFTRSGTLAADGYLRVVIGGRGPYIEFQTGWQSHMRGPAGGLYRFHRSEKDT